MTLDEIALSHKADKSSGWHDYCVIYEKYFEPLRESKIHLLEIGVQFGASIKTWLDYFPNAYIAGVDVANDFKCDDSRYSFTQGDQGNQGFWESYNPWMAEWDVILDDGPHLVSHQKVSFDALWPKLASGGLYIIEDTWVFPDPLWKQKKEASEFLTQLIWWINKSGRQYYGRPNGASDPLMPMDQQIEFIHFYPGTVIIKKR